jgi:glycosyltransferase involved in cell wall biosynthesis
VQTKRVTQLIPQVSVITVVKNDSAGLEKTLLSLIDQIFINWECLIISASSEDDTRAVANQFARGDARVTHYFESTPGIYQSMNQGVGIARGPYIVFMNAGDVFANPNSIEILFNEILESNYPVVVGGYSTGEKEYSFKPIKFGLTRFSLNRRWGCHQSMLFNLAEVKSVGKFSEQYKLASDFELVLKLVKKKPGRRLREVVSIIDPNGISNTQIKKVLKEKQKIRSEIFGRYALNLSLGHFWTYLVLGKIRLRLFITEFTKVTLQIYPRRKC